MSCQSGQNTRRIAGRIGEGVGKTVAVIQSGQVPAFNGFRLRIEGSEKR
jgi:hypothetical protein